MFDLEKKDPFFDIRKKFKSIKKFKKISGADAKKGKKMRKKLRKFLLKNSLFIKKNFLRQTTKKGHYCCIILRFQAIFHIDIFIPSAILVKLPFKFQINFPIQVEREIQIHQTLSHPHVVRLLRSFQGDDNVYLLLELCSGGSLQKLLDTRRVVTVPEARYFTFQVSFRRQQQCPF